jgi:hypothetical protein
MAARGRGRGGTAVQAVHLAALLSVGRDGGDPLPPRRIRPVPHHATIMRSLSTSSRAGSVYCVRRDYRNPHHREARPMPPEEAQ